MRSEMVRAQHRPAGLGTLYHARRRTDNAGQKKPTNELNKLGDAFIHVGLDRLLSLGAQYKGK
jgi:hypothetical protein